MLIPNTILQVYNRNEPKTNFMGLQGLFQAIVFKEMKYLFYKHRGAQIANAQNLALLSELIQPPPTRVFNW